MSITPASVIVVATGATIHHGGGRAFYRPSTDSVQLPPREAFIGTPTSTPAESDYSTLCHELCHGTSHESRCNRQLGKRFGDQAYAVEELVAELGAAFLCADLRITDAPRTDHAQYLASWLAVMKADKKAIFTAASKASEAAAFLAALQPHQPAMPERGEPCPQSSTKTTAETGCRPSPPSSDASRNPAACSTGPTSKGSKARRDQARAEVTTPGTLAHKAVEDGAQRRE